MGFAEVTKMQGRQELAYLVLEEGWSVRAAAKEKGVCRATAQRWVERAKAVGLENLKEESRRPNHLREETHADVVAAILDVKARFKRWGAKKIHAHLYLALSEEGQKPPVSVRTVDRLLFRHGLVKQKVPASPLVRFERENCNELWQLDYKGVARTAGFRPLSILDDCSRYCLHLEPLASCDTATVTRVLWDLFSETGLPEAILCDNGDGFNDWRSHGPTQFEAFLWRMGIETRHGRVRHPQTQGKVERFHGTLQQEMEELSAMDIADASSALSHFKHVYNWIRPHEAIGLKVPGVRYTKSERKRPNTPPVHEIPEGAISRKVDAAGKMNYKGSVYRPGKGLYGEYVEIRLTGPVPAAYYAGIQIAPLAQLKL